MSLLGEVETKRIRVENWELNFEESLKSLR